MDILEAKRNDVEQIVSVFHDTIHIVNSQDYTPEEVNAWSPDVPDVKEWAEKRLSTRITFVADDEGIIVGFGELETTGHIDCLYCHHNYQRRGVGAAIFRQIENKARALGLRRLFVEASITARLFFETQGFTIVNQQTVVRRGVELTNFVMEKYIGTNLKKANEKDAPDQKTVR